MPVVNPYTGRHISTDSRRYRDIEKTGGLDLTIRLPIERNDPRGTKGVKNEEDPLSTYPRNGNYNLAFNYMFRTGESIPSNIIGNVLNELLGYRISFYSLKDDNFSTHVVSNAAKRDIMRHLVVPRDKHFAILGIFKKRYAIRQAKEALLDRQRLRDKKETAPLPDPEINYVKNEATGRMVRVGSRKYKELFPEAKKHVGRPSRKEKWDPVADYINLVKEFSRIKEGADEERISEVVNAMSNRKVMVIFSYGKMFEFLAKRRKEFLAKLLKEGLPKNNVIDIMVSKKPDAVHTSTLKKVAINSKTNKPIDPKILAKKTKLKKDI